MPIKAKEKKERALGTKLFLKAYRSHSPKSAMVRRPNRPGVHGAKRTRAASEFKLQLMEKQKMRITYGVNEAQMKSMVRRALSKGKSGGKSVSDYLVQMFESRLDNVIHRMGFAPSRIMARQFVSHGHIKVNGRKVNVPSYTVKPNDIISIKEASKNMLLFKDLPNTLKGNTTPEWVVVDDKELKGTMRAWPIGVEMPFNINLIIDFYSR